MSEAVINRAEVGRYCMLLHLVLQLGLESVACLSDADLEVVDALGVQLVVDGRYIRLVFVPQAFDDVVLHHAVGDILAAFLKIQFVVHHASDEHRPSLMSLLRLLELMLEGH